MTDEFTKGRKDIDQYKPPVPRPGTKVIPFETIRFDNRIEIKAMTEHQRKLYVGTDKGLYVYDERRGVMTPVKFQE